MYMIYYAGTSKAAIGKQYISKVEASGKGRKRRQDAISVHVDEGLLINLSNDPAALVEAGKVLKQKNARQKKKPIRFGDQMPTQEMIPKSGLVKKFTLAPFMSNCSFHGTYIVWINVKQSRQWNCYRQHTTDD